MITKYRNIPSNFPDEIEILRSGTKIKGSFVCANCLMKRKAKAFGGFRAGAKLCILCYPYVDEHELKGMLTFDKNHGTLR